MVCHDLFFAVTSMDHQVGFVFFAFTMSCVISIVILGIWCWRFFMILMAFGLVEVVTATCMQISMHVSLIHSPYEINVLIVEFLQHFIILFWRRNLLKLVKVINWCLIRVFYVTILEQPYEELFYVENGRWFWEERVWVY